MLSSSEGRDDEEGKRNKGVEVCADRQKLERAQTFSLRKPGKIESDYIMRTYVRPYFLLPL